MTSSPAPPPPPPPNAAPPKSIVFIGELCPKLNVFVPVSVTFVINTGRSDQADTWLKINEENQYRVVVGEVEVI